MAAEQLGEPI